VVFSSFKKLGCVHGEDLMYVFGVPFYFYGNGMSKELRTKSEHFAFTRNFTLDELQLSENVMTLWTNFIHVGYVLLILYFHFVGQYCTKARDFRRDQQDYDYWLRAR